MSSNSLTSAFSLGVQSAYEVAATAYNTALATVSGVNIEFDSTEPRLEHPSAIARSTAVKAAPNRKSYKPTLEGTFALYPNFIGTVLRGLGMGVSTVAGTGYYTHTFTIATDATMAYLTAIHKMVGTTNLERKVTDVRLESLNIEAGLDEIMCDISGFGRTAGRASGSETKVAEVAVEMSTNTGTLTPIIAGTTSTSSIYNSHSFTIDNTLKDAQRKLFSSLYGPPDRESFGVTGTLSGIDIDEQTYLYYQNIIDGVAGTSPSSTPSIGSMYFKYESPSVIGVTAVPYSLTVTLPSVAWSLGAVQSSGNELIRVDATYTMVDDVATPLTMVLVNNVASYA